MMPTVDDRHAGADHWIRPANHADVEQMLDVHESVAAEGRWIGTEAPIDRERVALRFHDTIDAADAGAFVAVAPSRVVGDLGLHPTVPGVIGVGMAIIDGHRGRGVGSALLATGLEWCRDHGRIHKVELEVWPHNAAAIALYTSFGFVAEGRRVRHHRRRSGELWDSIVMGRVLDHTSPGSPYPDA